jgi:hypothetical protein
MSDLLKNMLSTFQQLPTTTQIFIIFALVMIMLIISVEPGSGAGLLALLGAIRALWLLGNKPKN